MLTFGPRAEKLLAAGLSVFLLASIVFVIAGVFALGRNWLEPAAPVLRWDMFLFSNAVFLFAIGWTDFPEKVRRSLPVRSQVQCLTIWQALLGLLVLMTTAQASYVVLFAMFGPAVAIVSYSAGSAYRAVRGGSS
jgi:hypothetical protein